MEGEAKGGEGADKASELKKKEPEEILALWIYHFCEMLVKEIIVNIRNICQSHMFCHL